MSSRKIQMSKLAQEFKTSKNPALRFAYMQLATPNEIKANKLHKFARMA